MGLLIVDLIRSVAASGAKVNPPCLEPLILSMISIEKDSIRSDGSDIVMFRSLNISES